MVHWTAASNLCYEPTTMARILILFAHPLLEKSRVHARLAAAARSVPGVSFRDLYELYPEFDIDVRREQQVLLDHDIIIWQHPFYWYSAPPLLKQWQDLVLEHGWAYGRKGNALEGKIVFQVLSTGGSREAYQHGGYNKYPIQEYLRPFERTAELCKMSYWPPYWVDGVHRMEDATVAAHAQQYRNLLLAFSNDLYSEADIESLDLLNALFPLTSTT